MKKQFLVLGVLLFVLLVQTVEAKEVYYKNKNDVSLTKEEYDFFTEMYWDGYQEYLTSKEYNEVKKMNLFEQEIFKETISNYPITRGSTVNSNMRVLSIAKSCSSNCYLTLNVEWIGTPTVKSYDVLGIRTDGVQLLSVNPVTVFADGYTKSYSNPKKVSNGFGYSVLLPSNFGIRIATSFSTTKGGYVYGSYQHAMKNTTELISNQYNIGLGGYGSVFDFYGTARNIYDNAPGVDISL